MSDEINKTEDLVAITLRYYENLFSLRVFNEQIGQMAEDYDQATRGKFFTTLAGLAGLSDNEIDVTGNTPFELRVKHKKETSEQRLLESPKDEVAKDEEKTSDQDKKNIIEVEVEDVQRLIQIAKFLKGAKKHTPKQSRLLRQGALISLISYFESLEADLLNFYYLAYPAALPSEGKLLSLADLREIGSIDEAEKTLIMKEIDAFLHDSTEGQIDYFIKRFKVDLKCVTPYLNLLLEIILRRNLVVHNNGVVNKIYLKKVGKDFIKQNDIKEGDKLEIDEEYLSLAIDTVCVFGTMLIQQSWRKWNEKSAESADQVLREYTYDLLLEKRWGVVRELANYASTLSFASDIDARIIKINQAIALKEENKISELEALLNKQDWSSCALKFHVANFALREQYDKMIPLLAKAVAADELDKESLDEWPLFRWFRETSQYESVCTKLFPKLAGG
jgi:hypothetical protein